MNERDYWDDTARGFAASGSPWGPGGHDSWKPNTAECMAVIRPAIDLAVKDSVRGRRPPRFLDLGCGIGRFSVAAALAFPKAKVIGVDVSPEMLAGARAVAESAGVSVEWLLGDGANVPEVGAPLIVAWSVFMLQHVDNDTKASYIRQVGGMLAPGGVFRFQFCVGETHEFLAHRATTKEMVAACASSGLDVVTMETGLLHPEWVWITARK